MKKLQLGAEHKEHIISMIMQGLLYIGALLPTCYFVEFGIVSGMFPFFHWLSDAASFGNMLAVFVTSIALVFYEHATDKALSISYIVMIVIATVSTAVFGNGTAVAFMLFIPLFVVAYVNPLAEKIKRLLTIFFVEAFLIANMSLLFNYTDFIHTQGTVYSLESSIIGELALAIFALIVMKELDKLPQDEDISHIRLCTLRKKCRSVLMICGLLLVFVIIISWDMGMMQGDVFFAIQKSDGTVVETGIFTNVFLKLFYGINRGVLTALQGNIFSLFASKFGIVGGIGITVMLIYLSYILYRHIRYSDKQRDALDLVAVVGLLQFVVLPVCMEMVIFYCICIFCCAIRKTGWKLHIFQKKKEECGTVEE